VPLIISLPEHRDEGIASVDQTLPVSLGDVFPTLCGLANLPVSGDLDGLDLSQVVRGQSCEALIERPGAIVEHLTCSFGEGTEYRMIRSPRFKYVAFRDCPDLAYDLDDDPEEQHNLVGCVGGAVADELAHLRARLLDGFDFAKSIWSMDRQVGQYRETYPLRIQPKTSNQILRGDGLLVEADQPLNYPDIVSRDLGADIADYPGDA
jgi:arylsulfatase A-like enzyme